MVKGKKRTVSFPGRQKSILRNPQLLIMVLPGLLLLLLFRFIPLTNIVIAFKDYNIFKGIWKSDWVGFDNFRRLIGSSDFYRILKNTFVISGYKILFGFPIPILLAFMLNEVKNMKFRKVSQNVYYLPYFLSWTIIAGLCLDVFAREGIINQVIMLFGGEPVSFLLSTKRFRLVLILSDIWKGAGWGSIIYLAALAGIDPGLYEAARMDGANRVQQMRYITLPEITSTILVMLIIRLSSVLDAGQDQILMLYNAKVMEVADIIDTYVYRIGISKMDYGFSTAVGLFKSVVSAVFVLSANHLAKKKGGGIW